MKQVFNSLAIAFSVFMICSCGTVIPGKPLVPSETVKAEARAQGKPVPVLFGAVEFPMRAASRDLSGEVVLRFDVLPDGTTTNIEILEAHPGTIFNESAIKAIKSSTYEHSKKTYLGLQRKITFRTN